MSSISKNRARAVHLLYDERMELHQPIRDEEDYKYENHKRVVSIRKELSALERELIKQRRSTSNDDESGNRKSDEVFLHHTADPVSREIITLAHTEEHYETLRKTSQYTEKELLEITANYDEEHKYDLYFCKDTFLASTLACGGVVQCVDRVLQAKASFSSLSSSISQESEDDIIINSSAAKSTRAVAVVRPPGHHSCADRAMGFCFFNSVAVAAKYAISSKKANRVVIIDWDIHHGNGTQDICYEDQNILFISLHRAGFGKKYFYPATGRATETGKGEGNGSNLNIAWMSGKIGDSEYAAAFSELILPLVSAYDPDLVLISAGFDAAKGDLIGDCDLMPAIYYQLTKSLLIALGEDIPIVVALEGGYNLDVISMCMRAVVLALVDEPFDEEGLYHDEETENSPEIIKIDESLSKLSLKSDPRIERLRKSRQSLSRYWSHGKSIEDQTVKVKKTAIQAINLSIRCILRSNMWKGAIDLPQIAETSKHKNVPPLRSRTRSRNIKSEKSLPQSQTSSNDDLLCDAFKSFNLDG